MYSKYIQYLIIFLAVSVLGCSSSQKFFRVQIESVAGKEFKCRLSKLKYAQAFQEHRENIEYLSIRSIPNLNQEQREELWKQLIALSELYSLNYIRKENGLKIFLNECRIPSADFLKEIRQISIITGSAKIPVTSAADIQYSNEIREHFECGGNNKSCYSIYPEQGYENEVKKEIQSIRILISKTLAIQPEIE